ncbi:MAG: 2-oxoacid:acceptor oxidoreductase family protein, partial [Betaproteobacteria bacterium]
MLKKLIRAIFTRSGDRRDDSPQFRYPGVREVVDGNAAVILVEREASDASGAYPAASSAQATAYWAEAAAAGHVNASGRALIFVRPESEHAAAGVVAGMAMTGLRTTGFASGQGLAFMHEAFYAAVGKRLPYVLNMGCRTLTKAALNAGAGHDDYHSVDDTGFIQMLAKNAQEAADLNLIARKTAELSLTPAIVGQDGGATTDGIESVQVPERDLVAAYLGRPDDLIDTPTPAQAMLYGPKRPRVPALWDVDSPLMSGSVQNQDAYMQATAAQRPYFFDHIGEIADRCMAEYAELTGRPYGRIGTYRVEDADYLIVGMGSMTVQAEGVADWLREQRGIRVGVVNVTLFRPFPGDLLGAVLKGRKGVVVLERTDQPLAEDLPLMREVRACIAKCLENAAAGAGTRPYAGYAAIPSAELPQLYSGCYGLGARDLQPEALVGAVENMLPQGARRKFFYLSVDFATGDEALVKAYPGIAELAIRGSENPDLLPKGTLAIQIRADAGWGVAAAGRNLAATLADLAGWQIKGGPLGDGGSAAYQLLAGPKPIRVNCAAPAVDMLLAPDAGIFGRDRAALANLKKGGVLVLQSALTTPAAVWDAIPVRAQTEIVDKRIRVFYLDAAKIAREEAADAEITALLAGNAFQGAFFAASSFLADAGITEARFLKVFEDQMQARFAARGVAEVALRALQRGFSELREIAHKTVGLGRRPEADAVLPFTFKRLSGDKAEGSEVGRFWSRAARGQAAAVHPLTATALVPAANGILRDLTGTRLEHPEWAADKCTACGDCYAACPDAAIPGLVNTVASVFETAVRRVENAGGSSATLRPALKALEKEARARIAGTGAAVRPAFDAAIQAVLDKASALDREKMAPEFEELRASLGEFAFAAPELYWGARESAAAGSGGLFSLTVNPYACKGCGLCVDACGESALRMVPQTRESARRLKEDWAFWLDLPTTPREFRQNRDIAGKAGALRAMLLDKVSYGTTNCGDGACQGCGEKSAVHLFAATVTALMQPRVEAFVARIDDLMVRLDTGLRMKLTASVDLGNTAALLEAVGKLEAGATLADLSDRAHQDAAPIGAEWLKRNVQLMQALKA